MKGYATALRRTCQEARQDSRRILSGGHTLTLTEGIKAILPTWAVRPLSMGKKRVLSFRVRLANAHRAFIHESTVSLAIGKFGGAGQFDVAYRVSTADESVLRQSFQYDEFFKATSEYVPAADDVILDVGAHIGTFALWAASKVPKGKVYAIEASAETFHLLRINLALNRAANVKADHLALTDSTGSGFLHHDLSGNWGHTLMAPLSSSGEQVATDSLAGYLESRQIAKVHFAKFNCEGAEFPILLTSPPDVLRRIERMVVQYHCDLVHEHSPDELVDRLATAGFRNRIDGQTSNRGCIVAWL